VYHIRGGVQVSIITITITMISWHTCAKQHASKRMPHVDRWE
jgi:hypothetical protein